jgi:hypothetical protein
MPEGGFLPIPSTADPYTLYRRLRSEDPVHRYARGFYALSRYRDVSMMLRDPRFIKAGYAPRLAEMFGEDVDCPGLGRSMLFQDPPDHTRLRALVSKAFTVRAVESMRPRIDRIVNDLLDRAVGRSTVDVLGEVAYPLAVTVISDMLGVPREDGDTIKRWSSDLMHSLDALAMVVERTLIERTIEARRGMGHYFRGLIADRKRRPGSDLLSVLIEAEEAGKTLTEGELLATCTLLYIAGHETTVNLISSGLLALLTHPVELRRLIDDPSLIQSGVEELLRFDSPVQRVGRIARTDLELEGRRIRAGSMVVGIVGAANRDPEAFTDPEQFDLLRADQRHLAFGTGAHFCLGASLARLETEVALAALLRRMPDLRLAPRAPEWRPSVTVRGLTALYVQTAGVRPG